MVGEPKVIRIITHGGNFHTDDVFAVAALTMLLGDTPHEIVRSRDPEVIATGDYVVDVGGECDPERNRFDHHQHRGAGIRENGILYSSLGLVWRKYGKEIAGSQDAADLIEKRLVIPVDAADNGVETFTVKSSVLHPYIFHNIIEAFRATWKDKERTDTDAFFEILPIAKMILAREVARANDVVEGEAIVRQLYAEAPDKRLIVMDNHYPWEYVLSAYPEPLYVVKPHRIGGGRWIVKTVRDDPATSFKNRKNLPETWAGKTDGDLARVAGVPDAIFCHNQRYIAVAGSQEGALALAHRALELLAEDETMRGMVSEKTHVRIPLPHA